MKGKQNCNNLHDTLLCLTIKYDKYLPPSCAEEKQKQQSNLGYTHHGTMMFSTQYNPANKVCSLCHGKQKQSWAGFLPVGLPWPSPSHNKWRNVDIIIFREANHRIFVFLSLDNQVYCFDNMRKYQRKPSLLFNLSG